MSTAEPTNDPSSRPVLLVAYDGGAMSEGQLHLACRSTNDIGGSVRVLHVLTRPAQVPLQTALSAEERAHLDRLENRVKQITARYGVPHIFAVEEARSVGEAVIGEARESGARMIFIGLRERRRPGSTLLFSGTVRHILRHASCPVQIGYLPTNGPDGIEAGDGPA